MIRTRPAKPLARKALGDISLVHFGALIVGIFTAFMIFSTVKTVFTETLGGDLVPLKYAVDTGKLLFYAGREMLFDAAFIGFFLLCYRYIAQSGLYRPANGENNNTVDAFFAVLSLLLVLMLAFTNTGSIIRGEGDDNRYIDLAFALFQPFYLLIIYFYTREGESRLIHKITFTCFVAACVLSGFTGYLLYISPFLFSALRRQIGRTGAAVLLGFSFTLLPAIRMLKFLYLNGFDKLDVIFDDFGKSYLAFLEIVVDRFSYIPNVIFISDNADVFRRTMHSDYLPFFQGYIGSMFYKIFGGGTVANPNGLVTYMITGLDDSNSTFPLISYFDISLGLGVSVLVYGLIVNTIFMLLLAMAMKRERLFFVGLVVSYTLLLGGWFWPYMNFVQAVVVYLALQGFYKFLKYAAASAADPSRQTVVQPANTGE